MNAITHYNRKALAALLIALFCMVGASASAQVNKQLSKAEMQTDIDHFFSSLKQHHPNPYFFCSKDSVEQEKNRIVNNLPDSLSTYGFAKRIGTLNHLFDGHTNILLDFTWQDRSRVYIPSIFEIDSSYGLYIKEKYANARSKVISINGHDAASIMSQFKKYMLNEQIKSSVRSNTFLFKYCLPLLGITEPYTIGLLHDGKQELVNISEKSAYTNTATGYSLDFSSLYKRDTTADTVRSVNYKIDKARSLAILYYNSCDIEQDSVMQQKVKAFFETIDSLKIEKLIIDIRNNTGGSTDSNDFITDYIKHDSFTVRQSAERRISKEYKEKVSSKVNSYRDKGFFHRIFYRQRMPNALVKIYNGKVGDLYKVSYKERVNANSSGYSGKIFIVQGYNTFSSALDFAYWFKFAKRGTLVGDETGEPTDCFSDALIDTLPNSQLNFMVAQGRFKFPSGNIACGLKPDRYVKIDSDGIFLSDNEVEEIINLKR
ncbi:S41 family peptidase [Acetobacteroides hydrogenigenes]|uniref:Peptidase S41-like protein n=1 Tax=Acetobacteroides hydrogenigenes TaxID=979970 RepID=A0A4R2EJT1_9BACT|nr:S41 family peptidase [Acetobacteroides hydrogenigenes]TCN68973.1 peptidase S41-like protein [Acetobacteroides hydrogenigenes]